MLSVNSMRAEQKGKIVVERIIDGSNAALGGLQIGDVIRGTTARSQVAPCACRSQAPCQPVRTVHHPRPCYMSILARSTVACQIINMQ